MREQTYLVLLALGEGPRHGYAILAAVRELSAGKVKLGPGTLYGALDRLVREAMIEQSGAEVVEGRNRRYYRLTGKGGAALRAETTRISELATAGRRIMTRLKIDGATA